MRGLDRTGALVRAGGRALAERERDELLREVRWRYRGGLVVRSEEWDAAIGACVACSGANVDMPYGACLQVAGRRDCHIAVVVLAGLRVTPADAQIIASIDASAESYSRLDPTRANAFFASIASCAAVTVPTLAARIARLALIPRDAVLLFALGSAGTTDSPAAQRRSPPITDHSPLDEA